MSQLKLILCNIQIAYSQIMKSPEEFGEADIQYLDSHRMKCSNLFIFLIMKLRTMKYANFFFSLTWLSGPACVHLD
jgi:hypothetical protein